MLAADAVQFDSPLLIEKSPQSELFMWKPNEKLI